ncbi:MAG: hypothetical protein JW936_08550 [Sedimentisphaerales bacterium]|nr:hypothetical protein [Sedimentisphaerales bacterium]
MTESTPPESQQTQTQRCDADRRKQKERRQGADRRVAQVPFEGEDRRSGTDRRSTAEMDRRSGWDRRRGPGVRRSDERRAAEEGEMNDEQFEFIKAIEEYKKVNRRPFPTFTEVLEIAKALGYRKVAEPTPLNQNSNDN